MTSDSHLLYSHRKDFSHLKYLEEKSHFDHLAICLDRSIQKQIAPLSAIVIDNHQDLIDTESIIIAIENLSDELSSLSIMIESELADINIKLLGIDQTLDELLRTAKSPDQTWAIEQYSIAKDAIQRKLYIEALDYMNRAIDGFGDRPGFRLDHRFYLLRGVIRMGGGGNTDRSLIDLEKAESDFVAANRLAGVEFVKEAANALRLAGWCAYCQGNFSVAEIHYKSSVSLNGRDPTSIFELSKCFFRQGNSSSGIKSFETLLNLDYRYALRAAADADFISEKTLLAEAIKIYSQKNIDYFDKEKSRITNIVVIIIEQVTGVIETEGERGSKGLSQILKNFNDIENKLSDVFVSEVFSIYEIKASISCLHDLSEDTKKEIGILKQSIDRLILINSQGTKRNSIVRNAELKVAGIVGFAIMTIYVWSMIGNDPGFDRDIILKIFSYLVTPLIFGPIGAVVGVVLYGVFRIVLFEFYDRPGRLKSVSILRNTLSKLEDVKA